MEFITITVSIKGKPDQWMDLEVPAEVPSCELAPILHHVLEPHCREMLPKGSYSIEARFYGSDWFEVDAGKSLFDADIWDGAYLRLVKRQSSTPMFDQSIERPIVPQRNHSQASPVAGWRPLEDEDRAVDHQREKVQKSQNQKTNWKILE